jgi:hypothetical protein
MFPVLLIVVFFSFAEKQGLDTDMPLSPQWLMKVGENMVRVLELRAVTRLKQLDLLW